jgi:hypothetical protein
MQRTPSSNKAKVPATSSRLMASDPDASAEIDRLETEGQTHEDLMKGTNDMIRDLHFKGTWEEMIARLEQTYPQLIDDDFSLTQGGESEWLTRLEGKLGETEEQIRAIIAKL